MPTPTGHTRAIPASKVQGTSVYSLNGEKIGKVEDIVLDKMSNEIMFAIVGFGGFLGIGEKYHALPWARLDYNSNQDGYVVGLTREALEAAPVYDKDELIQDDGAVQARSTDYYGKFQ
jgi:sporulation protein YlmC with PRC-barrel domain